MSAPHQHSFDILGFVQTLRDKGYEQDKAEALAVAQRDFFANDLAAKDFVHDEVQSAKSELKEEIREVKNEVEKLSNKLDHEVEKLHGKIENEVEKLNNKIEHEVEKIYLEIRSSSQSIKIWVGTVAVLMTGALASIIKLL